MKLNNLIVFLMIGTLNLKGQDIDNFSFKDSSLQNVKSIICSATKEQMEWMSGISRYTSFPSTIVIDDIGNYLNEASMNKINDRGHEIKLLNNYKKEICEMFKELPTLFYLESPKFLYNRGYSLPIYFGLLDDSALTVLVTGYNTDKLYKKNTLTQEQYATKVITNFILPSMNAFYKFTSEKSIKNFGVNCIYWSQTSDSLHKEYFKPEFISFIATSKSIRDFVEEKITKAGFVNNAVIYIYENDRIEELKEVKITLK